MEIMLKRSSNLCLVLIMGASVILAQTAKPAPTAKIAVENPPSKPDEIREYQLRIFREHVLARALDNIKRMDEAGLRLSVRNQLLSHLASDKAPSDEKHELATQIAREALTDLREHNEEITPFMLSYVSNDLGTWIQKHRPNLIEDFEKVVKVSVKASASQHIRSLFDLEHGDVLAVTRIRQEMDDQGSLDGIQFWLEELIKRNSKEFEPLASYILARATEGRISFETLFWVSDIYLRPQTSANLKNRFLATVVSRTQAAHFVTEPAPQMAYDLLTRILPFVQQSMPELYDQALNQNVAMRASLGERQLAIEARLKRLKESANPVEDLISEAEAAKSKVGRNELLMHAAQLALEKKKFDLCLDTLARIDVNVTAADPDSWQRSIDQLFKNFVKTALIEKRPELAEKAATRIAAPLPKVEALSLLMRYCAKANDKIEAQRFLIEAAKVAESEPNEPNKAKAFFLLSLTCDVVDETKKTELLTSGIKAINNFPKPDTSPRDKSTYVQRLDNSGYELTKSFKQLTAKDENGALALVEKIQKPDLRAFALVGILLGLDELLQNQARR